jgi:hypothetical protein
MMCATALDVEAGTMQPCPVLFRACVQQQLLLDGGSIQAVPFLIAVSVQYGQGQ